MQQPAVITVESVTQRFRVFQERPDSIRALFSKFFRHEVLVHDFDAVKDVSFTIGQGEMVGIIGRNGSGKSTLLKMIAGVYKPTVGRVEVHGKIAPMIELGAGFHMELTGRENILINGLLLGYSKKEIKGKESRILEFAEIGDFIDAPVKQYSSGMFMRLAFAVAIEVDPDILLVDEILAVGDMGFQEKCFERLHRFRAAHKTILFVTHAVSDVEKYCDRAILIDQGQLLLDGNPHEVVDMYKAITMAHEHPHEMLETAAVR
ncbi:MAG TPA: ABC transporter ATP-binding protein [Bryobacteraceae bacterium]|jgi:ABC-type polysaccharide/polyol phosphate transport system ATPase subunit|nr:ABC transporter ATP-binding protein [Bryobacteraceae bacterium]